MPYVYLLQPAKFINTDCYKIGISSKCDLNRLKSYGVGSRYIQYFECYKYEEAEKELINNLNNTKELTLFQGREYFSGDKNKILKIFMKVMNKYVEMDLLNAENTTTDNLEIVELTENINLKINIDKKEENVKLNNKKSYIASTGGVNICKCCEYKCKDNSDFKKHLKTFKHKQNVKEKNGCENCFKVFSSYSNKNRHYKKCVKSTLTNTP